jgi:hypothetical protein
MVELHDSTPHSTQDEQGTENEQKVSNIEEEYKARYGARNGRYELRPRWLTTCK